MASSGIRLAMILMLYAGSVLLGAPGSQGQLRKTGSTLVVHEWGTFTSVAREDGQAVEWQPLEAPTDLPAFVYGLGGGGRGSIARNRPQIKGSIRGTIRMETPVVYFYSDRDTTASVSIEFPKGWMTEWYPNATREVHSISWPAIRVLPQAKRDLPAEQDGSRYYHARETDSAIVETGTADAKEAEKFLFYRGVGSFDLPIRATLVGNRVQLKNIRAHEITPVILFEKRAGRIGFTVETSLSGEAVLERPVLNQDQSSIRSELERILIASGLYEREAVAMVETWANSWLEDGCRVFYVMPGKLTEEVLPLKVDPTPSETVRVLVGRCEIITPEVEREITTAVNVVERRHMGSRTRAIEVLRKYRRLGEPILLRIFGQNRDQASARIAKLMSMCDSLPVNQSRVQ